MADSPRAAPGITSTSPPATSGNAHCKEVAQDKPHGNFGARARDGRRRALASASLGVGELGAMTAPSYRRAAARTRPAAPPPRTDTTGCRSARGMGVQGRGGECIRCPCSLHSHRVREPRKNGSSCPHHRVPVLACGRAGRRSAGDCGGGRFGQGADRANEVSATPDRGRASRVSPRYDQPCRRR